MLDRADINMVYFQCIHVRNGKRAGGIRMLQMNRGLTAARPADLKRNNRIQILELFKSGMVLSVADIAREIGISRQTVMKAIQFYLEKGIIVSEGKANSGSMGGKRAELFSLPADRCLFNILISPSGLQFSLFNFRGETIDACAKPGVAGLSIDEIARIAWSACDFMMQVHGVGREQLFGVCVSSPGIVERHSNRLRYSSLFPEWGKDIPLAEKLADYFGGDMLIMTENVGKVCGSAFLHETVGDELRIATVFSGWGGIVASHMVSGMILKGKDALIGEIGHMILAPEDDEVCGCGSKGCFERQVSLDRLKRLMADLAGDYPDSPLARMNPMQVTIRRIFEASAAGDPLGRQLSAYAARFFASALRNLTLMFNPELVILQGDYAHVDDCFRETLYNSLKTFRYYGDDARPFELRVDKRSIMELTTLGAYTLLIDRLFSAETTYE